MKRSISRLTYLAGALLMFGLIACEGPEGPPGADGMDGADGTNGVDGADGNANVTTVSLTSTDIIWTAGSFLGTPANVYSFTENAVNQDIIDHGTVLGYFLFSSQWWAMPFTWENSSGTSRQYVLFNYALNTISLYAYQTSGVLDPSTIEEYRFLLITDNTVTKSAASAQGVLDKLDQAGIDVNNYYEVMDYFGLDY
jgi:hypothetical protein